MELEELKKKYAELGAEIERIEKGQQGRWKPEENVLYYFIDGSNRVINGCWGNRFIDEVRYEIHNCFKTKEEAQAKADKIKIYCQLYDLAERLNKGEKIDWKDNKIKCSIFYNYVTKQLELDYYSSVQDIGQIYCLDENFLDEAIEEIGEDNLKKLFEEE